MINDVRKGYILVQGDDGDVFWIIDTWNKVIGWESGLWISFDMGMV